MKWKIRVVSIILCTAMLIGLLPAEQVFASTTDIGTNLYQLGFEDTKNALAIVFNDKSSKTYVYKGEGVWDSDNDSSVSLKCKGNKDAFNDLTTLESELTSNIPANGIYTFSGVMDRSSSWFNVRVDEYAVQWDDLSSGTARNIILTQDSSVITGQSSLLSRLTNGLGFVNGDIPVYTADMFWIDTSVNKGSTSEDIRALLAKTDSSWYYQRIKCDYIKNTDEFVYTFNGLLQYQGEDNVYIVAQYTSKTMKEHFLLPVDVESDGDEPYKGETQDRCVRSWQDKFEAPITSFYNSSAYIENTQEVMKGLYNTYVQETSSEEQVTEPVVTVKNKIEFVGDKAVGVEWVNNEGLEYYLGLFHGNTKLMNILTENTTFGKNFETSVTSEEGSRNVTFNIKVKRVCHTVELSENWNNVLFGYIGVPTSNLESFVYYGWTFDNNNGYMDPQHYGASKLNATYFVLDAGEITAANIAWQTKLSQSIGASGDGWPNIVAQAYSKYKAIELESDSFVFTPTFVQLKELTTKTDAELAGYKHPFLKVFLAAEELNLTINYESDTGVKVAAGLSQILKDGTIVIEYTLNDGDVTSKLNWKKMFNSSAETLKIDTSADLIYCLTYLKYLYVNEYDFDLNTVEIRVGTDNKYLLFYSDEAKASCPLQTGYFWGENKLGTRYSESYESGWTYINTIDYAFKNLSNIGLIDSDVYSKIAYMNNLTFIMMTGEPAFNSNLKPTFNGLNVKNVGIYKMFGFSEDNVDAARTRIDTIMGQEMFTGHVLGVLSDAQHMYVYSTQLALGQIGADGIAGIDHYQKWDWFCSNTYSRASNLEGSKYADEVGSSLDYLPRLPILNNVELPSAVYTLLYNVEYAAAVCDWSTLSENTGIDVDTMEEFLYSEDLNTMETVAGRMYARINEAYKKHQTTDLDIWAWANSGVYDDMNDDYMGILRAIVSIHDLCDQLYSLEYAQNNGGALPTEAGIELDGESIAKRWSPAIYGYYMIYEKDTKLFEALSKNLVKFIAEDFSYSTPIEPLGFVIKFEDEQLSAQWKYGYALSSMYVPFQTNVYEVAAIEEKADNAEWVTNFYYKYGFYRKALYITTDPDAVVNRYTAGIQSGTKVATLRDLLNYNRDIELYVDQGFYNGDLLEEQLDRFIQNTNEGSVFGSIYDACNLTPDAILKDGGYATYSSAIQAKVRPFGYEIAEAEKEEAAKMFAYEDFILSEDEILGEDGMLSAYEYSIQQPYGLVSAMYRSGTLFNKANQASVQNEPVFVSSKNANAIGSYNKGLYRSFYNYLMLSAMEETIERETTLLVDLDAPIFIDIFGNILTSDGYVIIPAAANPTLVGEDWVPYTLGFATYVNNADPSVFKNMTYEFYDFLYGINYAAAIGKSDIDTYSPNFRDNQKKIGGGYFFLRQNGTSTLGTTNLTDGVASTTVNWDNPNTHVAALKNLLFSVHYLNTADMYSMTTVNMILEVLRGAPIEFIDYTEEGITTTHALTKGGATVAYMSEQLLNSVQTDSNGTERNAKFSATLNVLDLFHIESAEKVALLAVKLLLIGFLILLAVQIIADASVGKMPVKTVGRIIVTCVLTGTCISLLPVLTEFSLSKLTQMFLQPEAAELLAMQAQRDSYGIEIGITESYNTESSTDIIVKVGELDVQWYDLLLYSVYSSIDDSFTDLYTKAADGLPLAEASYTFTSGKNIYMDLGKIMDSTVVQYNGELGLITNERTREMSDDDMSASYLFPYYVFLDQLVANVNLYNKTNGVQPLSYNINSDGSIRTQDMTYAYFHCTEFMTTDYDILDLYRILNINTYKLSYCPYFSDDDLVTIGGSLWYPTNTDTDTLTASVELLYQSARDYVANNSSMLSYVSDGAFLKSLAMYLAVEYNSIFGVGTADAFELKCVDTKDMLRYVVSHPKDVYKYATRSFSRYAFEVGGSWSAIFATALYVIMCVTNAIKVVAYVLTYVTAVWSIVYHRVFKRESDYSVYGFFILIGEITILNVIYSASLKVMMNLTRWGMPGIAAICLSILLQGGIIVGFLLLCFNGVKNVKNLGQKEIHRIQSIINNFNKDRSTSTIDNSNQPERTVAVLQAHDFSRRELDNYNGDRANVSDLLAHDRRREAGQIGQEATES